MKVAIVKRIQSFVKTRFEKEDRFRWMDSIDLHLIHKFYSRYHPMKLGNTNIIDSKRNVTDRQELIMANLQGHNCLDIGCQAGFFSFKIGEKGFWVTGLDRDPIILKKANLIKKKYSIKNVEFKQFEINLKEIDKLPFYDNALYLSIHHHMIKIYGFDVATKILTKLGQKAGRLFLDFPYYEDIKNIPAFKEIPNMGSDPHAWFEGYLRSCGFDKIKLLGVLQHPEKTIERRPLYMVERSAATH